MTLNIIITAVCFLCFMIFGLLLYPETGVCTLVGTDHIMTNNTDKCKQLINLKNTCQLLESKLDCDEIGNNVGECININGVENIDNCIHSHTLDDKIYNSCVNYQSEYEKHFVDLPNKTTCNNRYIYNFKNNKYDKNITKSIILLKLDNNHVVGSYIKPCYYTKTFDTLDTLTMIPALTYLFGVFSYVSFVTL